MIYHPIGYKYSSIWINRILDLKANNVKVPMWVRKRCPIFFHDFIRFLLLHGGTLIRGYGCDHNVLLTLRVNQKGKNNLGLGGGITPFLSKDKRDGST